MPTTTQTCLCPLCQAPETQLYGATSVGKSPSREYHCCAQCSLIFVPNSYHLDLHEEKQRYDLHQNSPQDKRYVEFLSKLTVPLIKKLKLGWEGIDFGCGPGPAVQSILKEEGYKVSNYDPFYFPDKDLLTKKYDFICSTEVVEHLRNPREVFLSWDQLMRAPGSLVAVMTEVWQGQGSFFNWWYLKEPTHITFYRPQTFRWIAQWLNWNAEFPHPNVVIFTKK